MKIEGKVAIVTGGASGLGRATADALIASGAKVAIWDMNEELGTQAAAELGENAMFIKINVTDEAAVEAAVQSVLDKFGAIHILANIAGIARPRLVINKEGPTSLKDFTDVIDIDLVAPYNIIRHVAWAMSKNEPVTEDGERGVIINTSSAAADHGQRGQQSYSAAKGGLNSMALPIARGLARNGIRIAGIGMIISVHAVFLRLARIKRPEYFLINQHHLCPFAGKRACCRRADSLRVVRARDQRHAIL